MVLHVTEKPNEAEHLIRNVLVPAMNRPAEELKQRFMVGSAQECAEKLEAYAAAGVHRVFVWPITDELRQLEIFREKVTPLVRG